MHFGQFRNISVVKVDFYSFWATFQSIWVHFNMKIKIAGTLESLLSTCSQYECFFMIGCIFNSKVVIFLQIWCFLGLIGLNFRQIGLLFGQYGCFLGKLGDFTQIKLRPNLRYETYISKIDYNYTPLLLN